MHFVLRVSSIYFKGNAVLKFFLENHERSKNLNAQYEYLPGLYTLEHPAANPIYRVCI